MNTQNSIEILCYKIIYKNRILIINRMANYFNLVLNSTYLVVNKIHNTNIADRHLGF